jgi:hypothetical protein
MKNPDVIRIQPENVGKQISKEQRDFLLTHFKDTFPDKTSSLELSKSLLSYILTESGVSGIRFMYGKRDSSKSETCIVLMPCGYDYKGDGIPNIILQENYFLHTGEQVSIEETWKILFNHVMHEHRLNPSLNVKKIHRGDYWGINRLMDFINYQEAASLRFSFGYSPLECDFTQGIHPVLEAMDINKNILDIFMDFTGPCPTSCVDPIEPCIATNVMKIISQYESEEELNILRQFRDDLWFSPNGHLVELYYHTSPVLTTAIDQLENKEEIYKSIYYNSLKPCFEAINAQDDHKTCELFVQSFKNLANTYCKKR